MILILTAAGDPHADHVGGELRRRGADVLRFDPSQFPVQAAISVAYGSGGPAARTLQVGDRLVDLATVDCVWYRRPKAPVPHPGCVTSRRARTPPRSASDSSRTSGSPWTLAGSRPARTRSIARP